MIRIERRREPSELIPARETGLSLARAALRTGARPELSGYEVAKAALAEMQHYKCCYCEKVEEQPKYRDVEHYRPKSQYWWLTWTWDNLLFACIDCNREHKRDRFPLAPGSVPLTVEQLPPGGEQPLVLDPADRSSDPTAEIEFRPERVQRRERWRPYGLTERGRTTIDVCGLDRPSLLTLYTDHVVRHVRPRVTDLLAAHRDADAHGVVRVWRSLLAPARPFRALSYDALRALIPADVCARYQLALLRPVP
jgi:hypothetical protein